MKLLHKALILGMLTIGIWGGISMTNQTYAANPDAFIVEVTPNSFEVSEAVDITIKAVTADGSIIKDYQGDVFIEIEGIVDTADYTVPSDGLYTFLPQDQGMKLFSKGLTIKKSGTFTIKVSDIIDDSIVGKKTVIVGSANTSANETTITIISPVAGGIEKNNVINIMASAATLPNSPYEIYINNVSASQGMTSANGDISAYVGGINQGDNILQIKILNGNNEIIGESETITFGYQPISDGVFTSISINPAGIIKQGAKASFTVNTSESVTSAQIKLSDGKSVPMERKSAGVFTKDILMDTQGNISVDVNLIILGQTKSYTKVTSFMVEQGIAIGKIRLYSDSIDKSKLNVTWETIGTAAQFQINYGTGQSNLSASATVPTNEIIIENLLIGETYYFQIVPLDQSGTPIGTASEITQTTVGEETSCVVVGIVVVTGQIGDKYYLMRSGVTNIEKYVIYRSEFETSDMAQMQKVGETTGTIFEYPFNPTPASKQYKYAYYLVEGVCKDGTTIKIDNAKKITVGPAENIMIIMLIAIFGYITYKLYGYSKN